MLFTNQGNTQIVSPFGTLVVEQRDRGFEYPRVTIVPEPSAPWRADPATRDTPAADRR